VENGRAVCPWHHWAFDLETGQMPGRPLVKVRTYPTRLLKRQGKPTLVQVEVPLP
jgi:nitrite reductase/ring-hydroxylating ferredoxin subunit